MKTLDKHKLRPGKTKLSFIIAFIFLLSISGVAIAVAKQPVEASTQGIIFEDIAPGSRTSEPLNREQAAVILARALQLNLDVAEDPGFHDINISSRNYKSIAAIVSAGIVQGYSDGTFKPDQLLTRAEMAKILVIAYRLPSQEFVALPFKDVSSTSWYAPYLTSLIHNKITFGTSPTTYSPNNPVTRGEMALFIYRCQQAELQQAERTIESDVTTITADSIQLGNDSYDLTADYKTWLTPENLPILKNSTIKARIIGAKIISIESITIDTTNLIKDKEDHPDAVLKGNGAIIDTTVILKGNHLSLKDITITKDLIIENGIQNSLYFENVLVKGSTILSKPREIKNSPSPKLHFHHSTLQTVKIELDRINLKLTGTTRLKEIDLLVDADIEADANIAVPIVRVGNGSLNTVLNARIDSLFIDNTNSRVTLKNNARIEDLRLESTNHVKSIFIDYELIKHKIIKINGVLNINLQPPTGGGGEYYAPSEPAENSQLVMAKNAVAWLFTDPTKSALRAGVDQAAIDAARAKVDLLEDGTEKSALLADLQLAQNLLSPILAPPALTGTAPNTETVRFTFSDDAAWRDNITGVYLNGNSLPIHSSRVNKSIAGSIEINLSGASLKPGTHTFLIKATGYADAVISIEVAPPLPAPILTGSVPNNETVRFEFSDDAAWRDNITGVYLNNNLALIHPSRVNRTMAGRIDILLLLKPGTHTFIIKATGYEDAIVIMTIDP